MFFKNRNIISKIQRSKVTDYAALIPSDASDPQGLILSDASDPQGLIPSDANDPQGLIPSDANDPQGLIPFAANDPQGSIPSYANDPQGLIPPDAYNQQGLIPSYANGPQGGFVVKHHIYTTLVSLRQFVILIFIFYLLFFSSEPRVSSWYQDYTQMSVRRERQFKWSDVHV